MHPPSFLCTRAHTRVRAHISSGEAPGRASQCGLQAVPHHSPTGVLCQGDLTTQSIFSPVKAGAEGNACRPQPREMGGHAPWVPVPCHVAAAVLPKADILCWDSQRFSLPGGPSQVRASLSSQQAWKTYLKGNFGLELAPSLGSHRRITWRSEGPRICFMSISPVAGLIKCFSCNIHSELHSLHFKSPNCFGKRWKRVIN